MMAMQAGSAARQMSMGVMFLLELLGASPAAAEQAYPTEPGVSISAPDPRDVDCLASAISYEAGNEPVEGQEAVAKVVLNRLHAPDFPKTVCGVIFQGSNRRTGCQFTFTCDGSLLRPRSARSLAAARVVAERVLRGEGGATIGDAINYHADYVSPVWSRSLSRVTKIGAHIFYRRPGGIGVSPGDSMAYIPATGTHAAPVPGTFAPWSLPTLAISRTGSVRAIGAPSVAPADQIGARLDSRQRDDQLPPSPGATVTRTGIDSNR